MDNQPDIRPEIEETEKPMTMESMDLHESYEKSFQTINRGDYLTGKVVKIMQDGIYVDIGYKQEGFIPLNQLSHRNISHPSEVVKEGDEIPVVVLKSGDMEGDVILSKKRADLESAWHSVTDAFEKEETLTATVVEAVKGGLLVDLGLRGFVPASQVDVRPVKDLNDFVGEALQFRVIELDRARRKVVLSRKKVLEEERLKMKESTLGALYEGLIIPGTVARLTDFGAFINLGGVDGLVHISEMSWKRIKHPSEVLKVGQKIDVMVLKVDPKRERISLSIRQALPDPWTTIDETVSVGGIIKGTVSKIAKKYVFFEVMEGVEGVIPLYEISDDKSVKAEDILKEGQEIEVRVIELNKEARRMSLSLKQAKGEGTKKEINEFMAEAPVSSGGATIGDILAAKLKASKADEKGPESPEKPAKSEPSETPAEQA